VPCSIFSDPITVARRLRPKIAAQLRANVSGLRVTIQQRAIFEMS
jgi:hypothetical protein